MPQKIEGTKWGINEGDHKVWLHRLGNIVLIDRRKNASLSNSLYIVKRDKYNGSIESRANTNCIFIKYLHWDISTIQENNGRVVKILKDYYIGNSLKTLLDMKK